MATFENNLWVDTHTIASGDRIFAEAMAIAEEQERLFAHIFERNGFALCELVFKREYGVKGFAKKWKGFEFMAANGEGKDGNVHGAGAKPIEKNRRDFFDYSELNLRKFFGERGKHPRKQVRRNGGDGADGYRAGDGIFLFDDVAAGGFEFAQNGTSARKKCLAEFGEAHGAAEAIEEACAKFVLELENLLGKRWLSYMRLFRGPREGASVGDGAEVAELVEFHRLCLSILSEVDIGTIPAPCVVLFSR